MQMHCDVDLNSTPYRPSSSRSPTVSDLLDSLQPTSPSITDPFVIGLSDFFEARFTRERDWTDAETSALLKFVNHPEFRPQRRTRNTKTHWELIVEAIQRELGANSAITVKRCQERMKTLTGDYTKVDLEWKKKKTKNENLTSADWHDTIKGCRLTVDWYIAIKEYEDRSRMQRQGNIDRNLTPDGPDRPSSSHLSTLSDPLEPVQPTSPQNAGKSITKHVVSFASSHLQLKRSLAVVLL
jgi:hypothetical protein